MGRSPKSQNFPFPIWPTSKFQFDVVSAWDLCHNPKTMELNGIWVVVVKPTNQPQLNLEKLNSKPFLVEYCSS